MDNKKYKYVYFIPKGGINDMFVQIEHVIKYCTRYKRILLLDTTNSIYKINFSDYFDIEYVYCNIIYNSNIIREILKKKSLSIYPAILTTDSIDILNIDKKLTWKEGNTCFCYKDTFLKLPEKEVKEDIIVYAACGGGNGFIFLKKLIFKDKIKEICIRKLRGFKRPYLCIHVRNTDRKCNYKEMYMDNMREIHSYNLIYICTDDKNVITFFKSKGLNVVCYTSFPSGKYRSLHKTTEIPNRKKMYDIFVDIYMATNCSKILSNSQGGFINLLRQCHSNRTKMFKKLVYI